jgi:hypothetical protein
VRSGSALGVAALALVASLGACGDDASSSGPPTTDSDRPPPTLPDDVEPGRGALVLGDFDAVLTVRSCSLDAVTDPATGVTTDVAVDLDDGTGTTVSVTRASVPGDLATVTETVTVTDANGGTAEAQRIDRSGTIIDLRAPGAVDHLLDVDGTTVRAAGVFGPVGAAGPGAGDVDGELLLRCG